MLTRDMGGYTRLWRRVTAFFVRQPRLRLHTCLPPSTTAQSFRQRTNPFLPVEMALGQCANCEIDATMKCSGCVDAPEYQPEDARDTVYCNRDCQKEHWPNHKAHCRTLSQRKKLLRAAQTLKTALLIYRSIFYDIDLTKIEYDDDGTLYLHQNLRSNIVRAKRGPFPEHLTTNAEHREAALANNQCTAAMALLGPLTRKLLEGMQSPKSCLNKPGVTSHRRSVNDQCYGPPSR